MRLYKVEAENIAYDEDMSMVILAEGPASALKLAIMNWSTRDRDIKELGLKVSEIDMSTEQIVDVSHYGD